MTSAYRRFTQNELDVMPIGMTIQCVRANAAYSLPTYSFLIDPRTGKSVIISAPKMSFDSRVFDRWTKISEYIWEKVEPVIIDPNSPPVCMPYPHERRMGFHLCTAGSWIVLSDLELLAEVFDGQ